MPSLCAISLFGRGKDARLLAQFCRLFSRMEAIDLGLGLFSAQKMSMRKAVRPRAEQAILQNCRYNAALLPVLDATRNMVNGRNQLTKSAKENCPGFVRGENPG